jgi:hypothetical protein
MREKYEYTRSSRIDLVNLSSTGGFIMWAISRNDVVWLAVASVVTLGATEARATPCQEFTDAVNWANKTTSNETFPVEAYFTKHYGFGHGTSTAHDDSVVYTFGYVVGNAPLPVLSGTLTGTFVNSDQGKMAPDPKLTVYVEIAYISRANGGQITYQEKLNGKPVAAAAPTVVKTTCVGDFLMTGVDGNGVITVGVSLQPSVTKVVPK